MFLQQFANATGALQAFFFFASATIATNDSYHSLSTNLRHTKKCLQREIRVQQGVFFVCTSDCSIPALPPATCETLLSCV